MKTRFTLVLLVVGAVCLSWFLGRNSGKQYSLGLQRGTLVVGLAAAESLRQGKIEDAQSKIDALVFSSAIFMLEDDYWKHNFAVTTVTPSLIEYRRKYRLEQSAWSPAEHTLNSLLNLKSEK